MGVQIGINYRGQSHELRGCINDARGVRKWLMSELNYLRYYRLIWNGYLDYHGFKTGDIVLLADDTSEPRYLPTRENMLNAMKWLIRSARPHDSLFFHCMSFNLFIRTRHLMTRRLWTWWPSQRSGRRWSRWLWPRFPIYRNVFGTSSQLYTVIFPLDYKKEGVILDDVWTPVWCLKYSNSCTGPT